VLLLLARMVWILSTITKAGAFLGSAADISEIAPTEQVEMKVRQKGKKSMTKANKNKNKPDNYAQILSLLNHSNKTQTYQRSPFLRHKAQIHHLCQAAASLL
jgi:hypothetical protein